jgi:DNA mismatch endonuclease (patch repair protein)
MADTLSKEKRSELMAKVTGKETKPEILVRKFLFSQGLRFRKNVKALPGTPDVVLPKYRAVIFVNGCFWHGHTCRQGHLPSSNIEYWENKIAENILRDNRKKSELENLGWKVIVVWQCEMKNLALRNERLTELLSEIISS